MASKLTDLKTETMERKQILEMLIGHCAGVANTKENGLVATKVYLDDLADELVNLFAIHNVVGRSEQLLCDDCNRDEAVYSTNIGKYCRSCKPF
jgi:hypothetical protein